MPIRVLLLGLALALLSACPGGLDLDDAGDPDAGASDAGEDDAGEHVDAGEDDSGVDAGEPTDGGHDGGLDGGEPEDAGEDDGGFDAGPSDGGVGEDAGEDAGEGDAGEPAGPAALYWGNTGVGLSGQALVLALHEKLEDTHQRLSYSDLHEAYQTTDWGRDGCQGIFDFYSTQCWSPSERCGNYSREGDCYNREHSWPKSWWGRSESHEAYSDLFHVIPADGYVNNRRSNHPLGEVEAPITYTSSNGSRLGSCVDPDAGNLCFEPTSELKGDFARIYFYMAVRYEGDFTCCQRDAVNGANIHPWAEALLRSWHEMDPVDDDERARNEAVYLLQGNRNPFVDYPDWVDLIADF